VGTTQCDPCLQGVTAVAAASFIPAIRIIRLENLPRKQQATSTAIPANTITS